MKSYNESTFSLKKLLKALLLALVITLTIFLVFALVLAGTDYPEKFIKPVVLGAAAISIGAASFFVSMRLKRSGWMAGGAVGLAYMLLLYICGAIYSKSPDFTGKTFLMIVLGAVLGSVCGIIAINISSGRAYSPGKKLHFKSK